MSPKEPANEPHDEARRLGVAPAGLAMFALR
jgi:hypothetical protein